MSRRRDISAELQSLIDELISGTISSRGIQRLEAALDQNPAAQAYFRAYCQLHVNLDAEMRAERVLNSFRDRGAPEAEAPIDAVGRAQPLHVADGAGAGSPTRSIADSLADSLFGPADVSGGAGSTSFDGSGSGGASLLGPPGGSFFDRAHRIGWLVAACCSAALLVLVLNWPFADQQRAEHRGDRHRPAPHTEREVAAPLARVQLEARETRFIPLADFGHVLLEGPADMEFLSPMRARLNRGRIKLRITSEKGHGYVVETPHGEVCDLGTEFGIDASQDAENGVVVFEGAVDLSVERGDGATGPKLVERLTQGEGLIFNRTGRMSRFMSIVTGDFVTFERGGAMRLQSSYPVIVNVADNIVEPDVRKFYEIVPGGMREDVLTYVDRPSHQWNGMTAAGMPAYLLGADYVKTFNNDKMRQDVEIEVTLARPAMLYVLLDHRVSPPDWLRKDFTPTGDDIGLDLGYCVLPDGSECFWENEDGPGHSVDETFSIWQREVKKPGVVKLGPNLAASGYAGMYAIAARELKQEVAEIEEVVEQKK